MASHLEGRLLRRSIPYVENWLAELTSAASVVKATHVDAAHKQQQQEQQQQQPTTTAAAAGKKAKPTATAAKASNAAATGASDEAATSMSRCCFAVGRVVEVSRHPESAKLYIEKIDLGDELNALSDNAPRTILSGLQEFVTPDEFVNRLVLVIANLEPRKIAGIASNGMVLCASTDGDGDGAAAARRVVLLDVPSGTAVGERVVFAGHEGAYAPVLKKKLAKCFDEVIAEVRTNDKGEVCWRDMPFRTSAGVITASLPNAHVS